MSYRISIGYYRFISYRNYRTLTKGYGTNSVTETELEVCVRRNNREGSHEVSIKPYFPFLFSPFIEKGTTRTHPYFPLLSYAQNKGK